MLSEVARSNRLSKRMISFIARMNKEKSFIEIALIIVIEEVVVEAAKRKIN